MNEKSGAEVYSADRFEYAAAAPDAADVTLDRSTQGKEELLERLAEGLAFPDYFGQNWDALLDCLSDLSWSRASEAIIDHAGIPTLPEKDLRTYLEILIDAADRRTSEDRPKLRIVFRLTDRQAVIAALAAS